MRLTPAILCLLSCLAGRGQTASMLPDAPLPQLNATEEFRSNKKTAEKRIFELVNSKIDDLIETAEYDW